MFCAFCIYIFGPLCLFRSLLLLFLHLLCMSIGMSLTIQRQFTMHWSTIHGEIGLTYCGGGELKWIVCYNLSPLIPHSTLSCLLVAPPPRRSKFSSRTCLAMLAVLIWWDWWVNFGWNIAKQGSNPFLSIYSYHKPSDRKIMVGSPRLILPNWTTFIRKCPDWISSPRWRKTAQVSRRQARLAPFWAWMLRRLLHLCPMSRSRWVWRELVARGFPLY